MSEQTRRDVRGVLGQGFAEAEAGLCVDQKLSCHAEVAFLSAACATRDLIENHRFGGAATEHHAYKGSCTYASSRLGAAKICGGASTRRLHKRRSCWPRTRILGAGHYERTPERQGYANGYKLKRIDTPAGSVNVQVPKTAGHGDAPFYPQSLERGRRSVRAVMLAVAEMSIKG